MKAGEPFTDKQQNICRVVVGVLMVLAVILTVILYCKNPAGIIYGIAFALPLAFLNVIVWRFRLVW